MLVVIFFFNPRDLYYLGYKNNNNKLLLRQSASVLWRLTITRALITSAVLHPLLPAIFQRSRRRPVVVLNPSLCPSLPPATDRLACRVSCSIRAARVVLRTPGDAATVDYCK